MLGLRRGGLVPPREMEPGVVELGFQVSVVVEPDDGVRDRMAAAGPVQGAVEGRCAGARGGVAGEIEKGPPCAGVPPPFIFRFVYGLDVCLEPFAALFRELGGRGRATEP